MIDTETKITYGVIAALILCLGGLAYTLQPMGADQLAKEVEKTIKTSTTSKPLTTTTQLPGGSQQQLTQPTTMEDKKYTGAVITTNKGVIEIALNPDTPLTTANFGKLASTNFYNGVRFHRVIKGFMIQTGDPLSKDKTNIDRWGTGGPGYKFNDELTGKEQYPLGTVAMANSGPNTNGSQFFIVTANPGVGLPPSYTVFGKVTKGIDVALAIENVKTETPDRPVEDIVIEKVEVR